MIDFAQLKKDIPIENAVRFLGLTMKPEGNQLRGHCPCSETGGDRNLVVTPSKGVYYCFAAKAGGDMLSLVAHIKKIPIRESAKFIADNVVSHDKVPEKKGEGPSSPRPSKGRKAFDPEAYRKTLDPKHDLVTQLGLNEDLCNLVGMGVSTKGAHRGRFTFPIRGEDGHLLFYASATDFRMPKRWGENDDG